MAADKKNILAIDDDPMVLKVLMTFLIPSYELHFSKSAQEALDLMEKVLPDLILLDINMPGISGFDFLHTIKGMPKFMDIPVIIVSGHCETEFVIYAERCGASSVVAKPINKEKLFREIDKVLIDKD